MKYCVINFYLCLVAEVYCWKYFTSLSDLTLRNSLRDQEKITSQYTFGKCKARGLTRYTSSHHEHRELIGKVILWEWLDLPRIPNCIILRGTSNEEDLFRSTAYAFQLCVCRMIFCHSRKRFIYYYYEWYIPPDIIGGMYWDIYFYGPEKCKIIHFIYQNYHGTVISSSSIVALMIFIVP